MYVFDSGKPDYVKIDATDHLDCVGRYINDVDPYHLPNCQPTREADENGDVVICFRCTKNVEEGEEFRFEYLLDSSPSHCL